MNRLSTLIRSAFSRIGRDRRRLAAAAACAVLPALAALIAVAALVPALDASSRIPVAVVNLDEGATDAEGRAVAAGDDFVDSLADTGELAWAVVDEDAADAGLADGTYALIVKIPATYSERVASLTGTDPAQATIEIVSDGSENVLATKAGSAVLKQVQARLKSDLGENYLLSVLSDVRGQASRITMTSDGTTMLQSAFDGLEQGTSALADGLDQTAAATGTLAQGIDGIAQGVTAAGTGAQALAAGLDATAEQGVGAISSGAALLGDGLDAAASSAAAMGTYATQLAGALDGAGESLSGASGDLAGWLAGSSSYAEQQKTLAAALESATGLAGALGDGAAAVHDGVAGAREDVSAVAEGAASLAAALKDSGAAAGAPGGTDAADAGTLDTLAALEQRYGDAEGRLDALMGELEGAFDAGASSDARPATDVLADIKQVRGELAAIAEERAQALADADALAAQAQKLAERATAASEALAAADDAQEGLAGDIASFEGASEAVSDAAADLGATTTDLADRASRIASAVTEAQLVLNGTTLPTGETVPSAAESVRLLGQGIAGIGSQLSADGLFGGVVAGLEQGAGALRQALGGMADATATLGAGNVAFGQALGAVNQGTGALGQGIGAMAEAERQLGDGVAQLGEASSGIADTLETAGEELSAVSANHAERAEVAANPVRFRTSQVNRTDAPAQVLPVAAAAALWLGALACALLAPGVEGRAVLAGRGGAALASQAAVCAVLALAQAALAAAAGVGVAGLSGTAALAFAGLIVLAALAFTALALAVRLWAGRGAAPIFAALLALGLVSGGLVLPGVFTEGLFGALGGVIPVNVAASGLRAAAAGSPAGLPACALYLGVLLVVAAGAAWLRVRCPRVPRIFAA